MSDADTKYKVQELGDVETSLILQKYLGKVVPPDHKKIITGVGISIQGKFCLTARDVETKEVAWEAEQDNLITDAGRRFFVYGGNSWGTMYMGLCQSKETPSPYRYTIATDASNSQAFDSGSIGPTINTLTLTKQYGVVVFAAPSVTRTLGTIALMRRAADGAMGLPIVCSYANISPSRVQTTTQTLEVIYKISMTPIY